ncbi:hypothetical protein B9L19_09200 [Geobacillus thermocatenulatus]|uniref:Uncharacterized protein n=1 Tax=Geobacillus thermocatenulatus TaxID=33938 RepID=A0A226Q2H2_9BACL|nr:MULTISPECIES: hypothetical protein [Geobacillus]ASS99387.1 hypothetical protein GT3921_10290 [Geobacillus thermocatenulatus]KLR73124.1 hypothetical protein ABH20_12495 [Geobacillus sp. T6]OXB85789.1 hypothetical protein B9L19_09200 [Geobacillus thermocatenulatus]
MAYSKLKWIIAILLLLSLSFMFYNYKGRAAKENVLVEKLLIPVYKKNGKSSMWEFLPNKKTERLLLKNREVMIFGDISINEKWLAYADAIGTGPWELFVKDLKKEKIYQLTNNDQAGEIDIEILNEQPLKIGVSRVGLSSPKPRIWIFDIDHKKAKMVHPINDDLVFDKIEAIDQNHILAVAYSSKDEEKMFENPSTVDAIKHTIYMIDLKTEKYKKVTEFKAGSVQSISYVPGKNVIVFGASHMYLNSVSRRGETGIYKFDLDYRVIKPLLTESMLKKMNDTPVEQFGYPIAGYLSGNETKLWFSGIPKHARKLIFGEGIEAYPNAVFEYDLHKQKVRKIFEKKNTFITKMSISYGI